MVKRLVRRHTAFGAPVLLSAPEAVNAPVWIQIAYEGVFLGYRGGPLVFTREMFARIIENLHLHPSFRAGPDGLGSATVVPYDYEHASEMTPTSGSIPQQGAPAPAWALDLQVRDDSDGKAQLWALTELGAKVRAQIAAKEYQWTSVAVWPNAIDSRSGKNVGEVLTSIAFTNHPFLEGMVPITLRWVASSPVEAFEEIRELFGLPLTATPQVLAAEVIRFGEMLAGDALPAGVEATEVVGDLRGLLGLPLLTETQGVIDAAVALLGGMTQPGGMPPTETPMSDTLTKRLAARFKCTENDDVVFLAAVKAADKAEEVAPKGDALDQLMTLFGSSDVATLLSDAAKIISKAKEAEGMVAALNELKGRLTKVDTAEAGAETDAVVASLKLDPATASKIRPIILSARKGAIGDEGKLAEFRKTYPLPPAELTMLTQRIFAGPGGQQLAPSVPLPPQSNQPGNPNLGRLAGISGANNTEKAMTLLRKEEAGFDKLDRREQVRRAGDWLRAAR